MKPASSAVSFSSTSTTSLTREEKGKGKESTPVIDAASEELYFRTYRNEAEDLESMMGLVEQELSEP